MDESALVTRLYIFIFDQMFSKLKIIPHDTRNPFYFLSTAENHFPFSWFAGNTIVYNEFKGGDRLRVFHAAPPQISATINANDLETSALPLQPMH